MDFINSMCYCYVAFKRLSLTNGFGHIFMLSICLLGRHGLLPSLNYIVVKFEGVFSMCFNVFIARLVGVYSGHLSNPQSVIDDMMRSKVLMFEKCRPA